MDNTKDNERNKPIVIYDESRKRPSWLGRMLRGFGTHTSPDTKIALGLSTVLVGTGLAIAAKGVYDCIQASNALGGKLEAGVGVIVTGLAAGIIYETIRAQSIENEHKRKIGKDKRD
jgi:ABC-type uncharacterized transport system permease subunit